MLIRAAVADELPALSQLCFRSKAGWGYDDDFMERCREELSFSKDDLLPGVSSGGVIVADSEQGILGVSHLLIDGDMARLEKLFVAPQSMYQGIGSALFLDALSMATLAGATALQLESDPYAEGFYLRMGALKIGDVPSATEEGRVLPLMRIEL